MADVFGVSVCSDVVSNRRPRRAMQVLDVRLGRSDEERMKY